MVAPAGVPGAGRREIMVVAVSGTPGAGRRETMVVAPADAHGAVCQYCTCSRCTDASHEHHIPLYMQPSRQLLCGADTASNSRRKVALRATRDSQPFPIPCSILNLITSAIASSTLEATLWMKPPGQFWRV